MQSFARRENAQGLRTQRHIRRGFFLLSYSLRSSSHVSFDTNDIILIKVSWQADCLWDCLWKPFRDVVKQNTLDVLISFFYINRHCLKRTRIWNFFCFEFFRIWIECRDLILNPLLASFSILAFPLENIKLKVFVVLMQ